VISKNEFKVGVATDLGHVDAGVLSALKGVKGLVLEANYEWRMLEEDMKRPFSTKQRISSQHGHLSNEQAADLVAELLPEGLESVILGHLSSDCNCPKLAIKIVREKIGEQELEICCAPQLEVTEWQSLVPPVDPAFYGELFSHGHEKTLVG